MSTTLSWTPNGRAGNATVTLERDGETIDVDTFNVTKNESRSAWLKRIRPLVGDMPRGELEQQILNVASQVQRDDKPASTFEEVEPGRVVRPELFHMGEVSGVGIPAIVRVSDDDGPRIKGRWFLYLRHHGDGRRERVALEESLPIDGGEPLWFHPIPSEPNPQTPTGWSAGSREAWLDGAPAPSPADVFARLCEMIDWFVEWPEDTTGNCATLASWVLLSYTFPAWPAVPYLYFGGPAGSGKSRSFDVLDRLVFRPLATSNISSAALFRTLHDRGGTTLFDEAEQLKRTNDPGVGELLSMLLAGYRRGGRALRLEKIGDGFGTVAFDVYGPKALACINGLPTALSTRAITIPMFRAPADSPKPRRRIGDRKGDFQQLRDDLHVLALEHGRRWRELARRPEACPDELGGRDYELWQPLLALASWLETEGTGGLYQMLVDHATRTIAESRDDQVNDADATLLRIVYRAVGALEHPTAKEVLATAQESEPTTFKNWTARAVANHLRRYGITTDKTMGKRLFRPEPSDLEHVAKTYGIDLEAD